MRGSQFLHLSCQPESQAQKGRPREGIKLKEQCHEKNVFWRFEHFNQYSTFCVCGEGFKAFQKFVTTQSLTSYLPLWNYFQIQKMLAETLLIILLLCDWSMISIVYLSLAAGKMRKNYLVTGSFWYDCTESQAK